MPALPLSPDVTFPDPPHTLTSAVEQEMLDNGTLTGEDLDILSFGSVLPNLGLNFHSPGALLSAVDYFQEYNARTMAGAHPLTSFDAHHLLPDPEQCEFECYFQQMAEEVHGESDTLDDAPPLVHNDLSYADKSWSYPDKTEGPVEGEVSDVVPCCLGDEDNPNPFLVDEEVWLDNLGLADIPEHVAVIHAVVSWLHLQFHLPRIACNALLAILTLLLLFLNPSASTPFATLQSGHHLLGVNKPVYTLPVCPICNDVYPLATSPLCHDTCTSCHIDLFLPWQTMQGNTRALKTLVVKYPYLPLSEQIVSILKIPGIEATLEQWRAKPCMSGMYTDIFNGDFCCTKLKGPDGKLFFSNSVDEHHGPNSKLCLGVNLGVDWFSYIWSNITPSHSSTPTSFSICNLPPEYRYWTANLMCTSIMPGPKEQSPDKVQCYLQPIISNLLWLWKHGIKVLTESQPEGQLICVVLVAVVCDKPAAHKIGGFASHLHTYYCTECWISTVDKGKVTAFQKGAFHPWTNVEQCHLGDEYRNLMSLPAQKNFIKEFATRYSQLSCLPYFNLVHQIVIDLMHNLFLGLVKTHLYGIWVQSKILRPNHELAMLHNMLADFIVPGLCGKLPTDIRIPAGGSLTADQWLLLTTVYGPIVIWSMYIPHNASEEEFSHHLSAIEKTDTEKQQEATCKANNKLSLADAKKCSKEAYEAEKTRITQENIAITEAKKQARLQEVVTSQVEKAWQAEAKKVGSQNVEGLPEGQLRGPPPPPGDTSGDLWENREAPPTPKRPCMPNNGSDHLNLHPSDPANFLKLSMAIQILIKCTITDNDIDKANRLLHEYNIELIKLYGSGLIKPNHHYSMHIGNCAHNFGPLHDFWTFLFKHLNKVLKSFKANNHAKGKLETTFFKEFQCMCETSCIICTLHANPAKKATHEECGTVTGLAALCQDLDENSMDGLAYSLSPWHHENILSMETYQLIACALDA
ncbi:hypothetical protein M404DRAFT_21461 [Pisolithus tinctorius Marx 270]|uniref:Uncharacterized protein n=1 Tax=Pisolithus tinctorius Marx 270 TaxID=870435 RepID=A0A0C3PAB3_PISTI|nr:hypothetical protein M404DRAFT_21461 [Pisolithus tinctorius Marx 270]